MADGVPRDLDFLSGGGDVARLMRERDWSGSPLGPPQAWPQSLRSVVGLLLHSKFPMFVAWGPELGFLYNDPYAEVLGGKHPEALGARFHDVWLEIWEDIAPLIDAALAGEASFRENLPLVVKRKGHAEQAWFTFSYSPVRDEAGQVAGMFCAVSETTEQVLATRRRDALLALDDRLRDVADPAGLSLAASELLGEVVGAVRVGYGEIDADAGTVTVEANWSAPGFASVVGRHSFADYGTYVEDLRRGDVVANADIELDPRTSGSLENLRALGIRAFLDVPVVEQGRTAAMLFIHSRHPRAWTGEEVSFVREFAQRTRAAIARREAEQALRRSKAQLAAVVDSLPVGVGVVDPQGTLLLSNPEARRFLPSGRIPSRDPVHGGRWRAWDAEGRPLPPEQFPGARAIRGERVVPGLEMLFTADDGRELWTTVATVPITDADGRPVAHTLAISDIDAVKRAAESLRETEARFRLLADSSPALIWVTDPNAKVTFANRRYEEVFGRPAEDIEGDGWRRIVHPEDVDAFNALFLQALAVRERFRGEVRVMSADGQTMWLHCEGVPRFDSDGRFLGYVGANIDITDSKLAEDRLREMNELLESRVLERTAELKQTEDALRQSQKLESMGQLTGGVAHDFNNLLTPILGALDMLQRRGLGGERERRLIDGAIQSAERAKTLVQRLLAFARRQPLQPSAVDLARLTRGMAELIASTTGPQIRVDVDAPPGLPPACADAHQLEMAVLNLAVNARDAMPDGGTLRIAVRAETVGGGHRTGLPPGDYLRLTVSDTGAGMDAETLARAIEPFFSTKGIGRGTGLGLSMVHGVATQLGGALDIASTPGEGTDVHLWLPRGEAPAGASALASAAAPARRRSGTVLLVDDEDLVRLSTADMLVELGYTVAEAASAEAALSLIESGFVPDFLITDHLMPGMSGTELARALRATRPSVRTLIVSGYAESSGIAADLPRLAKPFRGEELAASLDRLVTEPA